MTRLILTFIVVVLPLCGALSKRAVPAVTPVIHEGVRYVAPNNDGRRGYIEAWDVRTNKKLWELTVFTNRIHPNLEEDVQWVFINKLSVRNGTLIVTSERNKTYQIDLKTKAITQSDPAQSPTPSVNPSYLHGDFNGDGKTDIAVLVKQRSTGKVGIAIIHRGWDKTSILGAGVSIGNGGDDFEWMDSWQVIPKTAQHEKPVKRVSRSFTGDALFVTNSDAASALIYWNGTRYVWFQQGD